MFFDRISCMLEDNWYCTGTVQKVVARVLYLFCQSSKVHKQTLYWKYMKNTKIIRNTNNFKNKLEERGCLKYFPQNAHRATQNELSITSKESCTCLLRIKKE